MLVAVVMAVSGEWGHRTLTARAIGGTPSLAVEFEGVPAAATPVPRQEPDSSRAALARTSPALSRTGLEPMTARSHLPLALALLAAPGAAFAQATANPVTSADDAFGFTIGEESVGIYDASSVRGFDLEAAGNYRVNGSYFVKSSGVSRFFLDRPTVRIGLNTLNVNLPGPSGVVDFKLRDPAAGEPSLPTTGLDENEQPYMDLLLHGRSADGRLSGALGLGLVFDKKDAQGGEDGRSWLLGGTARATLGPVTAQVFGGEFDYERAATFRFTLDDPDVRPRLKRGRFLGQDWARSRGQRRIAGLLLDAPLGGGWSAGATGVFSQEDPTRAHSQLFLDVDGTLGARSLVVASPQQRATAWSGEGRLSWAGETGAASHRVTVVARGRGAGPPVRGGPGRGP